MNCKNRVWRALLCGLVAAFVTGEAWAGPTGACCFDDGTCADATQADCSTQGGTYLGDATTCATVSCAGACCLPAGGCSDGSADQCAASGGLFAGHNTDCGTVFCDVGACCIGTDGCDDLNAFDCDAAGGVHLGEGTEFDEEMPFSVMLPYDQFDDLGGTRTLVRVFVILDGNIGAEAMIENTSAIVGTDANLVINGTIFSATVPEIPFFFCDTTQFFAAPPIAPGDTYDFGFVSTECDADDTVTEPPNNLAPYIGPGMFNVTLDGGGNVTVVVSFDQNFVFDNFRGFGNLCIAYQFAVGACCFDDGSCQDGFGQVACEGLGGVYQGDNSTCAATVCPQPCCFDDGTCGLETPTNCVFLGGDPQGVGQACVDIECPVACCFPDGSCQDLTPTDCVAMGGDPHPEGVVCALIVMPCPPPDGACCLEDETCVEPVTEDECMGLNGIYQGDDSICADVNCARVSRGCGNDKGSLFILSKIELRWDAAGFLIQDTFVKLTNDYPADVRVQMYFINGDPPLPADGAERAHTGWNWVDNRIELTANQPVHWSAATGLPQGVSPFEVLDPGFPPGRPDPENPGERMLRGYIIGWAVNASNEEIRWNHLVAMGTIVNYALATAWEYDACTYQVVRTGVAHGEQSGTPGELRLDGVEYQIPPDVLLFGFQAVGSVGFAGPRLVTSDTDLTLHPVSADLRQETDGPVTTKAHFDVWNNNEVKFSNTYRCITCWDQTLLSNYGIPNNFLLPNLQTDAGKARVDGLRSELCDVDFDPGNNDDFPFPPGPGDPIDPRDVVSQDAALLGLIAKYLTFDGGADFARAGGALVGMGTQPAIILYDAGDLPPEVQVPYGRPTRPGGMLSGQR
jgi:hypothetical protein